MSKAEGSRKSGVCAACSRSFARPFTRLGLGISGGIWDRKGKRMGREDPSEEEDTLWSALGENPEKSGGLALILFVGLMNPGHWG